MHVKKCVIQVINGDIYSIAYGSIYIHFLRINGKIAPVFDQAL